MEQTGCERETNYRMVWLRMWSCKVKWTNQNTPRRIRGQAQHLKKDWKASPKEDVTTKTSSRSRQRHVGHGRSAFSWDPDIFCSDSDGSVVNSDVDKPVTTPASVVDLTGSVSPAQSGEDVVLLSSGEEDDVRRLESEKLRRSSRAPVPVRKISLPPKSVAEDTLQTLKYSPGQQLISRSPSKSLTEGRECSDSQLDDTTTSEDPVRSGPSSPHTPLTSPRCTECHKLFAKMRRLGPPRTKKRDKDPSSLSCDEWLLKKAWHPQRRRHVKGKLWVHLKRIRVLAVKRLAAEMTRAWLQCSRPHVFLQRNLHRCRKMSSMPEGQSESKVKSRRRRLKATNAWPPLSAKYQRRKKRQSWEKDSTSQHLPALDLTTVTNGLEDRRPAKDDAHRTGSQRQNKAPKNQTFSVSSDVLDEQTGGSSLDGTRRVLKFDDSFCTLQMKNSDFTGKPWTRPERVLREDPEEFRTPPDVCSAASKTVGKSHPSFFPSGRSPHRAQKGSFRSMLAVFQKSHNRDVTGGAPWRGVWTEKFISRGTSRAVRSTGRVGPSAPPRQRLVGLLKGSRARASPALKSPKRRARAEPRCWSGARARAAAVISTKGARGQMWSAEGVLTLAASRAERARDRVESW
ncbi:hypothetical protein AOLI_G00151600 [Acnodon oligacanthus]